MDKKNNSLNKIVYNIISDMFVLYVVLIILIHVSLVAKLKLSENQVKRLFGNICLLLLFSLSTYKTNVVRLMTSNNKK